MEAMRWLALVAALAMPGCAGANVPTAGTHTVSLAMDQTSELVPAGQSSEIVARIRLAAAGARRRHLIVDGGSGHRRCPSRGHRDAGAARGR